MAETEPAGYSQSLERGLAILSAFQLGAARCSGSASSSRRLGAQPQHDPPLRRDARRARLPPAGHATTRKYRLGPRVLDLGFSAINSMELRDVSRAAPPAAERRDRPHREHGGPRRHGHRLHRALPELARGQREIDLNLHVGSRLPAYCTSMGKVLLAFLPDDELQAPSLDRFELAQPRPEHDHGASRALVAGARARARRRASRSTTRSSRTVCARSPRRCASQTGEVVAAINLAVHRTMVSMDELIGAARRCARADRGEQISARAGFRDGERMAVGERRRRLRRRPRGAFDSARRRAARAARLRALDRVALSVWELISRTGRRSRSRTCRR